MLKSTHKVGIYDMKVLLYSSLSVILSLLSDFEFIPIRLSLIGYLQYDNRQILVIKTLIECIEITTVY